MIMKTRLSNQSDFRHCLATSLCSSDKSTLGSIQRLWNQSIPQVHPHYGAIIEIRHNKSIKEDLTLFLVQPRSHAQKSTHFPARLEGFYMIIKFQLTVIVTSSNLTFSVRGMILPLISKRNFGSCLSPETRT